MTAKCNVIYFSLQFPGWKRAKHTISGWQWIWLAFKKGYTEKGAADMLYCEITHRHIKRRLNGHSACNQNLTNEFVIKGEQKPLWQTVCLCVCGLSLFLIHLWIHKRIQILFVNISVKTSTLWRHFVSTVPPPPPKFFLKVFTKVEEYAIHLWLLGLGVRSRI